MDDDKNLPPILIAVMGATGAGKSTFVNLASGSNLQVGVELESCTSEVQLSKPFNVEGRTVTLVDTPGFDDSSGAEANILRMIAEFLAAMYQSEQKLSGVVFLYRISDNRMGGIARKNFCLFRRICGDEALKHVTIATTMWSGVNMEEGSRREAELSTKDQYFRPVLKKGAKLVRHDNTLASARRIVKQMISNFPGALSIQREMVDQHSALIDTTAGQCLCTELETNIQNRREEIGDVRAELMTLRAKFSTQRETIEELYAEIQILHKRLEACETQYNNLREEGDCSRKRDWDDVIRALMKEAQQKQEREQDRERQEGERKERQRLTRERLERERTEGTRWAGRVTTEGREHATRAGPAASEGGGTEE